MLTQVFGELDGVFAKGGRAGEHLVSARYEIKFYPHSSAPITAANPISFWHTDSEHVVQVYGIAMFFPKISAYVFRVGLIVLSSDCAFLFREI
jgi:hypothetical protein